MLYTDFQSSCTGGMSGVVAARRARLPEPGHDCNTSYTHDRNFNSPIVRARAENYAEWMPSVEWNYCSLLRRMGIPGMLDAGVKHRFEISGEHDPAVSGRFVAANSLNFPHKFSTLLPPMTTSKKVRRAGQTADAKNYPIRGVKKITFCIFHINRMRK